MDRDAFLDRVRERLGARTGTYSTAHPLHATDPVDVPRMRWPDDPRPAQEVFRDALEAHGGRARNVADQPGLEDLLAEVVRTHGIRTAVVTAEPDAALCGPLLRRHGVEVRPFDAPEAALSDLGVTGAVGAIARTGTVVLDAGSAGGRSASLLPDVHLVLCRTSSIVAEPSDLWRDVPRRYPDGLPSQLVLATGPSKSADIEGTLTVGVHGPRAIWVGLLTG